MVRKKSLILTAVHWPKIWNPDSEHIGTAASTVLPVTMKNGVSEAVIQAVRQNNVSELITELQTAEIKDVNILQEWRKTVIQWQFWIMPHKENWISFRRREKWDFKEDRTCN